MKRMVRGDGTLERRDDRLLSPSLVLCLMFLPSNLFHTTGDSLDFIVRIDQAKVGNGFRMQAEKGIWRKQIKPHLAKTPII